MNQLGDYCKALVSFRSFTGKGRAAPFTASPFGWAFASFPQLTAPVLSIAPNGFWDLPTVRWWICWKWTGLCTWLEKHKLPVSGPLRNVKASSRKKTVLCVLSGSLSVHCYWDFVFFGRRDGGSYCVDQNGFEIAFWMLVPWLHVTILGSMLISLTFPEKEGQCFHSHLLPSNYDLKHFPKLFLKEIISS